MLIVNHPSMHEKIQASYTRDELQQLRAFLQEAGTFDFAATKTGLYPAAALSSQAAAQTGYGHVWVRDNVYVAHALALSGRADLADRVALSLAQFYANHAAKFFDIIDGARSHRVVMDRPGFRAEGMRLAHDLGIKVVGPLDGIHAGALDGGQLALIVGG